MLQSSCKSQYGVAIVSRIDNIIGLFCKRDLKKRQYSAKETYNFIDPTDRSHPILWFTHTSHVFFDSVITIFCMGWLMSEGSMKLYVSFAEYCLFHRAILQKRPISLSILLSEATPQHRVSILQMCRSMRRYTRTHTHTQIHLEKPLADSWF